MKSGAREEIIMDYKISEKTLKDLVSEEMYNDVLWEYDDSLIQIVKLKETDTGQTYNLRYNNLQDRYDVTVVLKKNYFQGYCNCPVGKQGKNCEHMIWSGLKIRQELKNKTQELESKNDNDFYLDLLRNLSDVRTQNDEISLNLAFDQFPSIELENFGLTVRGSILNDHSYKITNLEKFISDVELNKSLNYGKYFSTSRYKIKAQDSGLFKALKYIVLDMRTGGRKLDLGAIPIKYLTILFETLNNQYVTYDEQEYYVTNKINDIGLRIEKSDDDVNIIFNRVRNYRIINPEVMINDEFKTIYLIDEHEQSKIKLLENILNLRDQRDDLDMGDDKLSLNKTEGKEFLDNILPRIFNEFNVSLDSEFHLEIVEESLNILLSCYFENKQIKIKPLFMYGQYNALENTDNKLIKRNLLKENQLIDNLLSQGYKYDSYYQEFYIDVDKSQFIFLTQNIFDLRQDYEVMLDENIKRAILNFDANSIALRINHDKKYDYFEVNYDLEDISEKEIDGIIKSYENNREFYKLDNDTFIRLNDQKVYNQLLFLRDVVKTSDYKLNSYRVPKYKALLLNAEIRNRFSKYEFSQDFENYIESLQLIEEIPDSMFEGHKYELRDYQKEGVNWLHHIYEAQFGGLLADEMGLGKTIQLISFLQVEGIKSGLIVVPKALLYNWQREFEKFNPTQKVVIVEGKRNERRDIIAASNHETILLASYNSIIKDYEHYENRFFDFLAIDEAQYIKNPQTKTARTIKMLQARFYVALTGTPIENNLVEYWSIFDFLIPGYLDDLTGFKKKFRPQSIDNENLELLKEVTNPFILRRLKKEVLKELPDKIETNIYCQMAPEQAKIYKTMNEKFVDDMEKIIAQGNSNKKSMEILAAITRLRQISIDPGLVDSNYTETSGKVEVFKELIEEITSAGEKVLIFSQYTTMLQKMGKVLDEEEVKYYYLDGKTRPKQRLMDVEKFNKNNVPVYLISLKAGGVGLNLTSANHVIILDPWWNPATEDQAIDRSHRIGQESKVNVYRLISQDTIEEKIVELKQDKQKMISEVLATDNKTVSSLGTDELIELLIN